MLHGNQYTFTTDIVPIIISIVVICILIFSFYVTVKYPNTEEYKNTRINVFFSTLASVAIIFVGFNIVLTSIAFENNQKFSRITKTKEAVDKLWLYPHQLLTSSHNIRPEFLASFFMYNLQLYNMVILPNKKSPLTVNGLIEEQFISNVMIQAWEDCITIRNYDATPLDSWLRAFISWAQNPYFKSYYEEAKFQFRRRTVHLGDLLFEYAETIPLPTIDTTIYDRTVQKLTADPRFIDLNLEKT
ncbi:hypothetical protein BN59_02816 [Legionella massiliensis]|uniref:Uncharacterized protein n=1 Tax=Legionella massiliensis TaxID=1034943 RepID=A0A078L048_9GAMM|nr:hypothetical protein [Legionella massiliensis]CDZ78506.1 hypothetical protein BN59_02816 [Legionella massiliensis]CEE14244.1 hypothetical protein BN1094_02816 [Legionella massiliensis]